MFLCNDSKNEFDTPYAFYEQQELPEPYEKIHTYHTSKGGNYILKDERRNRYAAR